MRHSYPPYVVSAAADAAVRALAYYLEAAGWSGKPGG